MGGAQVLFCVPGYTKNTQGRLSVILSARGAWFTPGVGARAHFVARNRLFRHLFYIFFHITCLGTWNKIYPSCSVFRDILSFHS